MSIYFDYKCWQLRRWLKRNYEYPMVAVYLLILLAVMLNFLGYNFYSWMSLGMSVVYWVVCDALRGDHIAWHRQSYKERFVNKRSQNVEEEDEFGTRQHPDNE